MKTTTNLLHRGLITLTALLLSAAPLAAQENLKVDRTTVGGPGALNICVRDYGKTPAEAFARGAEILQKADAQLGEDKLHGDVRIRILPEKENGMFVVEVYSFPGNTSCPPVKPTYKVATGKELKVNRTTVGGPGALKICARDYGKTPEEAFVRGAETVRKADEQLGEDKLYGNVRIRILPEKENGLFVAQVYSFPGTESCPPIKPEYKTAQVIR